MKLCYEHNNKLFEIKSKVKNSITLTKGLKIKTNNIESAKQELSRDIYVIKGVLKETNYGLVVE